MNARVLSNYNCCTVGEMPGGVSVLEAGEYVGKDRRELSMVFQFNHMELDAVEGDKWKLRHWKLQEFTKMLRIWQQHMLGNHGEMALAS
jgi:alpha-glucosidase